MAKCLYSGDKPLGIVQSNAEDVAYEGNTSVKEKIDEVNTKIRVRGVLSVLALNNGKFTANLPTDGTKNFTNISANYQTINADIYGTIGAVGDNNITLEVSLTSGVITLVFTPSITLSQYTESAKGFITQIKTDIILTLS